MEEQTDDITGGEQTANRIVRCIQHLRLGVDLQAAEGEGHTPGNRVREVRRFVEGIGPVRFLRRDTFGAAAVQLGRIERNILADRAVEFLDGPFENHRLDADLLRQLFNRVCFDGMGKFVIAFVQKPQRLLIVDLIGDRTWLRQHRPTGLGVGVRMACFAFVKKTLAERIDGDAIGVAVAIGFVADFDIGKSRVDRRRFRG